MKYEPEYGYCVRERQKVEIEDARQVMMKNGRPAIQGVCSNEGCDTKIFKIGKLTPIEITEVQNNEVETASGGFVDMLSPDIEDINLFDIASALSKECRFGNMCNKHYSVAEHACLVAKKMEWDGRNPWLCMMALHHDDPEAYLLDVPSPLKPLFGTAYEILTETFEDVISAALKLRRPIDNEKTIIKEADIFIRTIEAKQLMRSEGKGWTTEVDLTDEDGLFWNNIELGLSPEEAFDAFLRLHNRYVDQLITLVEDDVPHGHTEDEIERLQEMSYGD